MTDCLNCHKLIVGRHGNARYCGAGCTILHKQSTSARRWKDIRAAYVYKERPCRQCQKAFTPTHNAQLYCNDDCQRVKQLADRRDQYKARYQTRLQDVQRVMIRSGWLAQGGV